MSSLDEAPMMPPLNNDEIREILDPIPIYTLVSKETGNLFLVDADKTTDKSIANFYLSSDFCRALLEGNDDQLYMESYGLGEVYFDYYCNEDKNTEYRLIPDAREVQQARTILQQVAGIPDAFSSNPLKEGGYIEIPIFMDQHLRLAEGEDEDDYREIFPMYLGWNDLVTTCQEYLKGMKEAGMEEEYEAAISVAELHQLIGEMRQKSPIDFRNVQLVPATARSLVEENT